MRVTNYDVFYYDNLNLWCATGDVHLPVSGKTMFVGWGATASLARQDFWRDAGTTYNYENELRCANL